MLTTLAMEAGLLHVRAQGGFYATYVVYVLTRRGA